MSRILITASPIGGHVAPMISAAGDLVERGHEVVLLTGSRFADVVNATGAEHVSLPPVADWDDRDVDAAFPGRRALKGVAQLRFDMISTFVDPMPAQYRAVRALLAEAGPFDVVLAEGAFTGLVPLALLPADQRPPVVGCGLLPMLFSSRDTAPFGPGLPPSSSPLGRVRNRVLNAVVQKGVFRAVQQRADEHLVALGFPRLRTFVFDTPAAVTDRFLQFTVPGFEYPRSDLSPKIRFAGRMAPRLGSGLLPDWWDELDGGRPVVHVTQGTIDTADLDRVVGPALRGLAGEDVLVVASTGGRLVHEVPGPIPANARVAEFLPYDQLLPKVDVLVTNGGYGGTQQALAAGVPVIVAGAGEDKPEVAARVAWSGAGIDLKTGDPTEQQVRDAVRRVRTEPAFRERAAALAREYASYDAFATLAGTVAELDGDPQLHLVK